MNSPFGVCSPCRRPTLLSGGNDGDQSKMLFCGGYNARSAGVDFYAIGVPTVGGHILIIGFAGLDPFSNREGSGDGLVGARDIDVETLGGLDHGAGWRCADVLIKWNQLVCVRGIENNFGSIFKLHGAPFPAGWVCMGCICHSGSPKDFNTWVSGWPKPGSPLVVIPKN